VYCGPVYTIPEALQDPQIKHRGLHRKITHPEAGEIDVIASPINFSATPLDTGTPPPMLGEHTTEVLKEVLSLSDAEIERLLQANVIALGGPRYAA
jgi:crotonobetainyl-CoA:carnitine CoA-transferase CaiB-like acyl-CoA transferase